MVRSRFNTGGVVDLDNLAVELAASGVKRCDHRAERRGATLCYRAGNTLTAHLVSLTADGGAGDLTDTTTGNVIISGLIDAIGTAGGEIDLYGKNNVDIERLAPGHRPELDRAGRHRQYRHPPAVFNPTNPNDPANYNSLYGYENMATSGGITLGSHALIDVAGGTAGGLFGVARQFPRSSS